MLDATLYFVEMGVMFGIFNLDINIRFQAIQIVAGGGQLETKALGELINLLANGNSLNKNLAD